jgi:hypothetical protein
MDLSDRLIEHDHWHTTRLLEQAATLPDDALDRRVRPGLVVHDFEGPEPDVRTMLERIVFTKEVWTAAIGGRDVPPRDERSIAALQARLAAVQPQFTALVRRIRDRNEWDDAFVDAPAPPVSFTFGSDCPSHRLGGSPPGGRRAARAPSRMPRLAISEWSAWLRRNGGALTYWRRQ